MHISILFIGNELLSREKRVLMHLPMTFISFGFVEGKLYKHFMNDGTFLLQNEGRTWGNDVVYGAIFALSDYDFYIRLLDSYHQCSLALIGANHNKDVHHRHRATATPISFNSIDAFERLMYTEKDPLEVQLYTGNKTHPKINQRLYKTVKYRIVDGVDKHFIQLFREVSHDE